MEVIMYFVIPILWVASCVASVISLIVWLVKAISHKGTKVVRRRLLISSLCVLFLPFVIVAYSDNDDGRESSTPVIASTQDSEYQTNGEKAENTDHSVALAFLDDFTEYGYTKEQIESMREILVNVGITEVCDLEIGAVSYGMQVVKGVAFRYDDIGWDKEVHVQFNIENGVLYYVHIYCPSYGTSSQPTYLSGLSDRRAELYYDAEGGYLKRIDWESKSVVDY